MRLGVLPPPAARRPRAAVPLQPTAVAGTLERFGNFGCLARLHDPAGNRCWDHVGRYGSARGALQPAVRRPTGRGTRRPLSGRRRHPGPGDRPGARRRGHYTREEFLAACRWKTPGSGPLVATNSAGEIETATRIALSDASTERKRVDGCARWPTSSFRQRRCCCIWPTRSATRSWTSGLCTRSESDQRLRTAFASGPGTSRTGHARNAPAPDLS
jgi:hypothetical protein